LYVRTFSQGSLVPVPNDVQIFTIPMTAGSWDAFVVKYNTSGVPQWARRIGATGTDTGLGISSDASGNVYVSGYATGAATVFALASGTDAADISLATTAGVQDAFVVKYNTDGVPQWARRIAGIGEDRGLGISSDASGNVYVAGFATGAATVFALASGTDAADISLATTAGNSDAFVVKYNTNGVPQWARRIGGTGIDQGLGISSDASGNVYVSGYAGAATTVFALASGTDAADISLATTTGNNDAFVVKYNTDGVPQWARRIGGTGEDRGLGISTDASGNVYLAGFATGAATVFALASGTDAADISLATTAGSNDAFVVKYNTSGAPQWARRIGGTGIDQGLGISSDASGNVYVAGYAGAAITVFALASGTDAADISLATTAGGQDAFVVKYNTNGAPQWARRIGGTGLDRGMGISSDASGNVYVSGYATGAATVFALASGTDAADISLSTTAGLQDAFVVKYNTNGVPQWARRIGGTGDDQGLGISSDASGNVYVAGYGAAGSIIIPGANI
jgi:sulfur carrier protein ThiS